jgi:hypothetical protein
MSQTFWKGTFYRSHLSVAIVPFGPISAASVPEPNGIFVGI